MSLWKLRVGAEAYYLAQVASGLEDYYAGHGESAGQWVGNAAPGLGLDGDVSGEDLRAVLAGLAPGTGLTPNGEQLRAHPRRVPGFDLTFSVPKSVSIAYALGDPLVQGAVIEAGEAAVSEALAWLEREACHVRRGTNRRDAKVRGIEVWGTRRLQGAGFVAAQFRHRTSRAGDPQLHWHVLVANATQGPDRRWTALDATGLYRSQRTAGVVFQTALRRELTRRLGVEWTAPAKDACEIAGIPQRIVRLFSKRRDEIEAEMERLGTSGSKAAEAATLATRKAKVAIDPDGIVNRWQHEAEAAGWGPAELDTLLARTSAISSTETPVDVDAVVGSIGERLTEHDATFTRHEAARAVAAALPAGAAAADVDRITAGVLAHPEIVPIHDPAAPARPAGWERRYTTRHLISLENELTNAIASSVASSTGSLLPEQVEVACAGAPLGADQRQAVTRLCTQGHAIEVLVGRAGTGKTFTLAAVASAYTAVGWGVVGVAPSARAARELETGARIESFTVPRFDYHIADHPLTANTVVVVDEAGMCGTTDIHHVVTTARHAGAKVILVGDHHQLPEVRAGGGLAAAIAVLGDQVCELTVNRRQVEAWEIEALAHLRHGDVATAWDAYVAHDRVRVADDPLALHNAAVDDWWIAHTSGSDALLLAGTRSEAHALNRLARQRAADEGLLSGPELTVAGRTFQAGDRVLICRNDSNQRTSSGLRTRIDNGMLGTVVIVHEDAGTLDVLLRSGETVRLDNQYLGAGHLDHGYAMTIHKSQGATCDAAFVVGPAGLYREAAYVALSRARQGAILYATSRQVADIEERDHTRGLPLPGEAERPEHDLLTTIARSEAKTFATSDDPAATRISDLAQFDLTTLRDRLHTAVAAEAHATAIGLTNPAEDLAALERARRTRALLVIDHRVRALDRENVGTITDIHDHDGSATVLFISEDGTSAVRTLGWGELKPIDHPAPVPVSLEAQEWLDAETARIGDAAQRWESALANWPTRPGEAADLRRAIATRTETLAKQLHADEPEWLTWWIGPRPADPAGATVWDDTIAYVAGWRDLHSITPDVPGLGAQPDDAHSRTEWVEAMTTILSQRTWLATRNPHADPISVTTLSAVEIHDRISELDRFFADAPPDQSRIIDDLIAGRLTAQDIHAALADATKAQTERDRWILANWPYIVEHHELQRLAEQHGPLAHWPAPLRPNVQAVLEQLAGAIDRNAPTEERTLTQLHEALAALAPGRRLRQLSESLVATNDQIAAVQAQLTKETDRDRSALLAGERDVLLAQQTSTRAMLEEERRAVRNRIWERTEADSLRAAIVHRTATVYRQAVTEHPEWVVDLLNELDDTGSLDQLRAEQIRQLIVEAAGNMDLGQGRAPSSSRPREAPALA